MAERKIVAERIIDDFERCVEGEKFGSFLRGLYLDRGALADALYELRNRPAQMTTRTDPSPPVRPPGGWRSKVLEAKRGGDSARTGAAPAASNTGSFKPPTAPSAPPTAGSSRIDALVRAAVQVWTQQLRTTSEDRHFSEAVAVPAGAIKEIASEIAATVRRVKLEARMRSARRRLAHRGVEQASAKAAIVCERIINRRFVSDLSLDAARPSRCSTPKGLGRPTAALGTILRCDGSGDSTPILANARSADGLIEDVEQNARLGEVVAELTALAPANA